MSVMTIITISLSLLSLFICISVSALEYGNHKRIRDITRSLKEMRDE